MPSFSDDQQVTTLLGSIDDTITAEVVAGAVQVSPFGESIVVEPSSGMSTAVTTVSLSGLEE